MKKRRNPAVDWASRDPEGFASACRANDEFMRRPEVCLIIEAISEAMKDPKNWKKVRICRTPKMAKQAARVADALRKAKPGELIKL